MPLANYTTTVTSGGTTTLMRASATNQFFTGTGGTIVLPVVSTLKETGFKFELVNATSGNLTVQSSGANNIVVMPPGTRGTLTCILVTGTTAASWYFNLTPFLNSVGTFDNIFMNSGGNIGYQDTPGPFFDLGRSDPATEPTSPFLRFTKGDSSIAILTSDLTVGAFLRVLGLTTQRTFFLPNHPGVLATGGYQTTATAAGTTTLTVDNLYNQFFTGSTTETVVLPVVTTLDLGFAFQIVNNSSGALTVNSSGGNLVATVPAGGIIIVTCILLTGTTAASWSVETPVLPTVAQTLTNKTLTTPVITGLPTGSGVASAATASTLVSRDAAGNSLFNRADGTYATTVTSGSTVTLDVNSAPYQNFSGSTAQTVVLPVASTLTVGWKVVINNNTAAAALTVQSSGANTVRIMAGKTTCTLTCILASGTGTASWQNDYMAIQASNSNKLVLTGGFALTVSVSQAATLTVPGAGGTLGNICFSTGVSDGGSSIDFAIPITVIGDVTTTAAGNTLKIKSGTNAKAGTFTLVAGTVTVSNTSVTANSVIIVTLKTAGGVRTGNPDIVPTAATGFVATQIGGVGDTSTYNFVILEVN